MLKEIIIAVSLCFNIVLLWLQFNSNVEVLQSNQVQTEMPYALMDKQHAPPSINPVQVAKAKLFRLLNSTTTGKFHNRHYEWVYYKYLYPHSFKRPKLLEIGLGCDVPTEPGVSVDFWLRYFEHKVDLWIFEFDKKCLDKYQKKVKDKTKWREDFDYTNVHLFNGDQANVQHLQNLIEVSGGHFDIIVDDGGHQPIQQSTSLTYLFPHLNPSGNYFLEDIWMFNQGETIKPLIRQLLPISYNENPKNRIALDMRDFVSMECFLNMCVFNKY